MDPQHDLFDGLGSFLQLRAGSAYNCLKFLARLSFAGLLFVGGLACGGDPPPGPRAMELHLSHAPPEQILRALPWNPQVPSLYEHLETLREVAELDYNRGLFLRVGSMRGAYARMRELSRALARVKEAGKPIHCYFEHTDNAGFGLLANACDRITIAPSGGLNLSGVRAEVFYARELLDQVGVSAELLHAGRFKSAADSLTRSTMPEHTRATLTNVVHTLQGSLVNMVAAGRALEPDQVLQAMREAPLHPEAARKFKLVDEVAYLDHAREQLRRAAKVKELERLEGDEFDLMSL